MDARTAAAEAGLKRVRRASGLLAAAVRVLAAARAGDVKIVGEAEVRNDRDLRDLVDVVRDRMREHGPLDVVLVARHGAGDRRSSR